MGDISLQICDKIFQVKKEILCEYSDYFRAMFSGNYVENQLKQISIDVLDPNIMTIVLQYMNVGLIDLSEYSLTTIADIAVAANFLQVTELIKQIEYTLEIKLCESNWMEIMAIAETSSYSKLEQLSAAFGLYSFKSMKPEHIPTIHKLAWYLSHPYLDTHNELDVFNFGLKWILHNETGADALLIVLGCLAFNKIKNHDMEEIKKCTREFENSLAFKVTECLYELTSNNLDICEAVLNDKKLELCEKFTERVWVETVNLTKESKSRLLKYIPVVPMGIIKDCKPDLVPHYMYTYEKEKGFKQWLEVADKNLWGWSVVSWGLTKLVIVCGELGRGSGIFMKDVRVYNTLKQEWTRHGIDLPPRRHAGLAVVGDSLYIIGGVGGFRIVLETAIVYDLRQRTYRNIAKLPDAIQNPAVCSHKNKVYAAGQKYILRYKDSGTTDCWENTVATEIRMSCITSFKDYIYCSQGYFNHMYRFRPDIDEKMELITYFSSLPACMCNVGNELIVFTKTVLTAYSDIVAVEQFTDDIQQNPEVLLKRTNTSLRVNDVAGSCILAMTIPPLCMNFSHYHHKYLSGYADRYELIVFTIEVCGQSDKVAVEQFTDDIQQNPEVLLKRTNTSLRVNDVAGSCVLAMTIPPLCMEFSQYHHKYLSEYADRN